MISQKSLTLGWRSGASEYEAKAGRERLLGGRWVCGGEWWETGGFVEKGRGGVGVEEEGWRSR